MWSRSCLRKRDGVDASDDVHLMRRELDCVSVGLVVNVDVVVDVRWKGGEG